MYGPDDGPKNKIIVFPLYFPVNPCARNGEVYNSFTNHLTEVHADDAQLP